MKVAISQQINFVFVRELTYLQRSTLKIESDDPHVTGLRLLASADYTRTGSTIPHDLCAGLKRCHYRARSPISQASTPCSRGTRVGLSIYVRTYKSGTSILASGKYYSSPLSFTMGPSRFNLVCVLLLAWALSLVDVVQGSQSHSRRQVIKAYELLDSYDFVVVGGGTSGLTVADR